MANETYRDYMVRFLKRMKPIKGAEYIEELFRLNAISRKEYGDVMKQ